MWTYRKPPSHTDAQRFGGEGHGMLLTNLLLRSVGTERPASLPRAQFIPCGTASMVRCLCALALFLLVASQTFAEETNSAPATVSGTLEATNSPETLRAL